MSTFSKNKTFKENTLIRLYTSTKFKYCSDIKLGALIEMEQIHLDGTVKPAAWLTDDIKYVAYGDDKEVYFFDRELLIKISHTKVIKDYPKTKTKGFHLTQKELKEYCSFYF